MLVPGGCLDIESTTMEQGGSAMARYKAPMTSCLVVPRLGRGHLMRVVFQQ